MDKVRERELAIQAIPRFMAFSKKKKRVILRDRFDVVLLTMKKDGTYKKGLKHMKVKNNRCC